MASQRHIKAEERQGLTQPEEKQGLTQPEERQGLTQPEGLLPTELRAQDLYPCPLKLLKLWQPNLTVIKSNPEALRRQETKLTTVKVWWLE